MNWVKPLTVALIALVVLVTAGSIVELFLTTFSIGANITPALVTVLVLVVVLFAAIAVGARNRQWLKNPDSYW